VKALRSILLALGLTLCALPARAQGKPALIVSDHDTSSTYTLEQLLKHPEAHEVTIDDPVYGRRMSYRAIPMSALLKGLVIGPQDYVQARATDNFSIGIPGRLMRSADHAEVEAFLAVEDPARPWPKLPKAGSTHGAGPLYVVWKSRQANAVSREYWAYMLAALAVVDSPLRRWPSLALPNSVPATDPIRTGLDRYVELCISCHKFLGAGEGEQGPDLGQPMNAVDYFQLPALKKLIRDPASVRQWPERKMPKFDEAALSEHDLDAMIAWLSYKAREKK